MNNRFSGPQMGASYARREPLFAITRRRDRRLLGGVAAGIAHHLQVSPWLIRALFLALLISYFPLGILAYILALFLMPMGDDVMPPLPTSAAAKAAAPASAAAGARKPEISERIREIERRLAAMEAAITAPEFELRRKFKDLE